MPRSMPRSLYSNIIIGATNCNPEDVAEIEDIMRNDIFHSTLDWQTRQLPTNEFVGN